MLWWTLTFILLGVHILLARPKTGQLIKLTVHNGFGIGLFFIIVSAISVVSLSMWRVYEITVA